MRNRILNTYLNRKPDFVSSRHKNQRNTAPAFPSYLARIGILKGGIGFLEIPEVQKMDFPQIPRIHADQTNLKILFAKNTKNPCGLQF